MKTLVLVRHGQSEWNKLNLFTGWVDVELSNKGVQEAHTAGKLLKEYGYDFDVCFTSYLKRAIETQQIILKEMDREWLPVYKSFELNERPYGALQGLNKEETAREYGESQVRVWRRSFSVRPPALTEDSPYNPRLLAQYRDVPADKLPLCESLEDTIHRSVPYYETVIKPYVVSGRRVMIAAHGNSLRSLVKYFEQISDTDIVNLEIPTGVPLVYEFDDEMHFVRKFYLGEQ